jgi:hypothetical protein
MVIANEASDAARAATFGRGFESLRWIEGKNVMIHRQWVASDPDRARIAARKVLSADPDAVVNGRPALSALHVLSFQFFNEKLRVPRLLFCRRDGNFTISLVLLTRRQT